MGFYAAHAEVHDVHKREPHHRVFRRVPQQPQSIRIEWHDQQQTAQQNQRREPVQADRLGTGYRRARVKIVHVPLVLCQHRVTLYDQHESRYHPDHGHDHGEHSFN